VNKLKSPVEIIRLPSSKEEQDHTLRILKEKFKEVDHPKELDKTATDQGMPASLLNFYLATQVDLSWLNLGKAVFIPVQIAEREGGRKSVFFLDQGDEVLTGIYVTCEGIALRFVKRVTGISLPAQIGDVYCTTIKNRDRVPVFEVQEKLLRFDPQTGAGQFGPLLGTEHSNVLPTPAGPSPHCCLFWSSVPVSWAGC
jgi:hypothetical protein